MPGGRIFAYILERCREQLRAATTCARFARVEGECPVVCRDVSGFARNATAPTGLHRSAVRRCSRRWRRSRPSICQRCDRSATRPPSFSSRLLRYGDEEPHAASILPNMPGDGARRVPIAVQAEGLRRLRRQGPRYACETRADHETPEGAGAGFAGMSCSDRCRQHGFDFVGVQDQKTCKGTER